MGEAKGIGFSLEVETSPAFLKKYSNENLLTQGSVLG